MKIENHRNDEDFSHSRYWLTLIVWSVGFALTLVAILLACFKADDYMAGGGAGDLAIAIAAAAATIGAGFALWRWRPDFTMGEPDTPRGRRMRWVLIGSGLIGAAATWPISAASSQMDGNPLFGNEPVPSWAAAGALAVWAIAMPFLIVAARRNMDEVARNAQEFSMSIAFQVFGYAAPIWWLGWRGGFLPRPDVMILFIATGLVAIVANLKKRSM